MIEVINLTKRYGSQTAVDNISFTIDKGEICGFLGPNGAGKTSTMRILAGYMPPTGGSAKIAGFNVSDNAMEVKKRVGYLPESNPLYTDMRVGEYLDFVAEIKGLRGHFKKKKVADVMEDTAISGKQRSLISSLSKGYRQRVGLAQALISDPETLILDEPSIGLDPVQITEIRSLIKSLSGKRTVILSTHILPEAQMICSRVMIINKGRLLAAGTPLNLSKRLKRGGRITAVIDGPTNDIINALKAVHGVLDVSMEREKRGGEYVDKIFIDPEKGESPRKNIVKLIADKGWDLVELAEDAVNLEEIYLKLVSEEGMREGEPEK